MLVLREQRVIGASQVEVINGGLNDAQCDVHLRVVDLVTAVAWLVPLNPQTVAALADVFDRYDPNGSNNPISKGSNNDNRTK